MIRLIQSDNFETMLSLLGEGASFQLIYADITFYSLKDYHTKDGQFAYSDKWTSSEHWLSSLRGPMSLARELLTDNGSIVVHCDPRGSHLIRGMLDEVCGRKCFASEIVWRYRRWPSNGANFQKVHDTLIRYVKDHRVEPRFNRLYEPMAESTIKAFGGRFRQEAVIENGKRVRSGLNSVPSEGVALGDVWDIPIVAPVAKERTTYPTQKPEKLLERLILSLTNSGDHILDPYLGSGTTLAVAQKFGRNAVGIDSSPVAIEVARKRLASSCDMEIDFH